MSLPPLQYTTRFFIGAHPQRKKSVIPGTLYPAHHETALHCSLQGTAWLSQESCDAG